VINAANANGKFTKLAISLMDKPEVALDMMITFLSINAAVSASVHGPASYREEKLAYTNWNSEQWRRGWLMPIGIPSSGF